MLRLAANGERTYSVTRLTSQNSRTIVPHLNAAGASLPTTRPPISRQTKLMRWGVVLVLSALVAGPVLFRSAPPEIARWYAAAALAEIEAGNNVKAEQYLSTAVRWDESCPDAVLIRPMLEGKENLDERLLAELNRALEKHPDNVQFLAKRQNLFTTLGKHQQALDDLKTRQRIQNSWFQTKEEKAIQLNELAYHRALAGVELEAAFRDVDSAMSLSTTNPEMLDTRGYIHFKRGKLDAAVRDLDEAIRLAVKTYQRELEPVADDKSSDSLLKKELNRFVRRNLAVLHYHRALALEKLERTADAERDIAKVRELGFEPDERLF